MDTMTNALVSGAAADIRKGSAAETVMNGRNMTTDTLVVQSANRYVIGVLCNW
jgi:hypothetical protein